MHPSASRPLRTFAAALLAGLPLALAACGHSGSTLQAVAQPTVFDEGSISTVTLGVNGAPVNPQSVVWTQTGGIPVAIHQGPGYSATVDVRGLAVAADMPLVFEVAITGPQGKVAKRSVEVVARVAELENALGGFQQIGGATTTLVTFEVGKQTWALFNAGNRLSSVPVVAGAERASDVYLPGYVADATVVEYGKGLYALVAIDTEGVAVVDISDPHSLQVVHTARVRYHQDGITWAESGGSILTGVVYENPNGPIVGIETDGKTVWLANAEFGLHRTSIDNLIGAGAPVLDEDGALVIDHEVFTVQFAREDIVWGGCHTVKLVDNRLFVAMDVQGLGIFDPFSLAQVGRYNHYTDASVVEDYFIDMDVLDVIQYVGGVPLVDEFTGLPDYRQCAFEINEVWKGDVKAPTPWADLDVAGKHYYSAHAVDVAEHGGRSIAYVAFGLGGLVAVDVTGFQTAGGGGKGEGGVFLTGTYLGYVPAMPAHGPREETGASSSGKTSGSLFRQQGAGRLSEPGAVDVRAVGTLVYFMDHYGGLVIVAGADDPERFWRGPGAPYDNDDPTLGDGTLGDHFPTWEFVTSWDMTPIDPDDKESLRVWTEHDPCLLATGEALTGHGNALVVIPSASPSGQGDIDLLQCTKSVGLIFIDLIDLSAEEKTDRFEIVASLPNTDAIGIAADSSATQRINISEAKAILTTDDYVYVAAGSNGVSVWDIRGPDGAPLSDPLAHVANSLQERSPQMVAGVLTYPMNHAQGLAWDIASQNLFSACDGLGLRRARCEDVEAGVGVPGRPIMLVPQRTDVFEHNSSDGHPPGMNKQDHAYGVAIDGHLAYVADGSNGLTIYDTSKDPSQMNSGFFVSNLGAKGQGSLGRTTGVVLWTDPATGTRYAFTASGPTGIGVIDVMDPADPVIVKLFQPIKIEDETKVGHADGYCTDLMIVGQHLYVAYDAFGVVCYSLADMIAPLPAGIPPTEIWKVQAQQVVYDHRPVALSVFNLEEVEGFEHYHSQAWALASTEIGGRRLIYVAQGLAGVVVVEWSDPASPSVLAHYDTPGEASAIAIRDGRLFVADMTGGIAILR